jgi:hypothetical protein
MVSFMSFVGTLSSRLSSSYLAHGDKAVDVAVAALPAVAAPVIAKRSSPVDMLCACQDHATPAPAATPRGFLVSPTQVRTIVHGLNCTGTNSFLIVKHCFG